MPQPIPFQITFAPRRHRCSPRPSREEAEAAVRTLIAFAGDDPKREGVLETPKRVVDAYGELYNGYTECPVDVLDRTFSRDRHL